MSAVRKLGGSDGRPRGEAERLRALFESMSEGVMICEVVRDGRGRVVDFIVRDANPMLVRRAPGGSELVGRRILEVRPDTDPSWFTACHVVIARRAPLRFEYWDAAAQRWFDVHMTRLSDTEVAQFYIDITERKRTESYLSELFDELNHRVKNNLTIVSGLLTMQARAATHEETREQLLRAVDRIQTIADLHGGLYKRGGKDWVDAKTYLDDLAGRLGRTLVDEARIRIDVQAEPVHLPLEEAVQLGVLVNELITNAAKHAYAQDAEGVIWVRLSRVGDDLCLTVADRGRGMAVGAASDGLGMRLVRSIAERGGGHVTIATSPGVTVTIRLPSSSQPPAEPQQNILF